MNRYSLCLLTPIFLLFVGCATADPTRLWVKKWNEPYASIRQKQEAAKEMELGDKISYRRELAGAVNKNFTYTPADYLEREIVYFKLALWAMNGIQYPAFNVLMHGSTQPPGYAESISKNVPKAREDALRYMRRLMELPNLRLFSRLLICRIQELNNESCAADIAAMVERGSILWEFSDNPSTSDNYYEIANFSGEEERIYQEKRGTSGINFIRTICTGFLVCLGGLKTKDESVIKDLQNTRMGLKIIFRGRYGSVKGAKKI